MRHIPGRDTMNTQEGTPLGAFEVTSGGTMPSRCFDVP